MNDDEAKVVAMIDQVNKEYQKIRGYNLSKLTESMLKTAIADLNMLRGWLTEQAKRNK